MPTSEEIATVQACHCSFSGQIQTLSPYTASCCTTGDDMIFAINSEGHCLEGDGMDTHIAPDAKVDWSSVRVGDLAFDINYFCDTCEPIFNRYRQADQERIIEERKRQNA